MSDVLPQFVSNALRLERAAPLIAVDLTRIFGSGSVWPRISAGAAQTSQAFPAVGVAQVGRG